MLSSIIRAGLIVNFALFSTSLVIPRVAPGTQFITGPCTADADCASGCCSAATALCAARLVALEGAGCGFGSSSAGVGAAKPLATAASAASTDDSAAGAAVVASTTVAAAASTGTQFITGTCAADADCASGCCSAATGLCAARLVALEGAGCGFGSSSAGVGAAKPLATAASAASTDDSAAAAAVVASTTVAAAASTGTQFITGTCAADADCASGCCSAATGLCAARLVALEGAGCGFGSSSAGAGAAKPLATAAVATAASAASSVVAAPVVASTTAAAAASTGTQFITGTCATDADCASGCCGKNSGLCAARLVALEGAGCGHTA
ncbi:hypothetical protein DFH07DRAFT_971424 [Mycena maculata]|uniref:Biotrophy-associated secreted protein 2 n=1 Tax=Mycena maculata TaxID=230809 RepID=A0AAD7HMB0_9AGAR|nr:hypothetical protein DFH07DRAFT_971424 [Mycena maculata]